MRIRPLLFATVLASCSSSAKPPTTVEPAAPAPATSAPATSAPAAAIDARPDTPSGDAAKRDAELAEQAAGFFDAFSNTSVELSPDGKRVAFVSTRDGLPQLYISEVAKPAAPATRVLVLPQRVVNPEFTPDGKAILFRSDVDANELWSIYRVGLDGKELVKLTPGEPLFRDTLFLADGVADTVFYSARTKAEARSTVYASSTRETGPAKALYTDDRYTVLSSVSRDGKLLFVTQAISGSEHHVVRVDTATGKAERLYPTEGKATVFDVKLSADGKRLYVATDAGGEQTTLLALDPTTGKVLGNHAVAPAYARLATVEVAKRGGLIALQLLVGNRSEVRLLDGATFAPKAAVKLPLGFGVIGAFSDDGRRLGAVWSIPTAPPDIYSIDTATGRAERLRREDRPTLAAMPSLDVSTVDIPAFDGGVIPTNVIVAKGEATKPHPVVVIYHGGPAGVSAIRWSAQTAFFASLGYAVVEPNVRGSTGYGRAFETADDGAKRLDAFKDIEASARWVAKQPWADKDRLVVFGGSYGGYTTLIALSHWPDIWRAGVDLFGVVDLKTFMATTSGWLRQLFLVEFGDPEKDAELFTRISPLASVDKIVDPTFVFAGANDPRVPLSESDLIVVALRQRKITSEYMVANDEGHSLARRHNQLALYARCARFLEQHLR